MGKINKDNIVSRALALSKQTLDVRAVTGVLAVTEMHAHSKSKEQIIEKLRKAFEAKRLEHISAKTVLDDRVQYSLSNDQLKALTDFISKTQAMLKRASEVSQRSEQLDASYNEAIALFDQALTEMAPYFVGIAEFESWGVDAIKEVWAELDQQTMATSTQISTPSTEDLELVNAFRILGTELELVGNKWQINNTATESSPYGMKEKNFKFSEPEVKSLIGNYLNVAPAQRKGRITPEGLFKVYDERAKQKIKGWKLNETEQTAFENELKDFTKNLDTAGYVWKSAYLTDPLVIQLNAQKIAYMELSKSMQDRLVTPETNPHVSGDIRERLKANMILMRDEDSRDLISRLEGAAAKSMAKINKAKDFKMLDEMSIEKLYDDEIRRLTNDRLTIEVNGNDPDELARVDKKLQAMLKARETLLANVEVLKLTIMTRLQVGGMPEDATSLRKVFRDSINESSIEINGDKIMVVENRTGVKTDATSMLADVIKKRIIDKQDAHQSIVEEFKQELAKKYGKSPQYTAYAPSEAMKAARGQGEDQDMTSEDMMELPDITSFAFGFSDGNGFDFVDAINDQLRLSIAKSLLDNDGPLYREWKDYQGKNPGKNIEDFAKETYPSSDPHNFFLNDTSIIAASAQSGLIAQDKVSPEIQKHISNTEENFGRNIVILDRAMRMIASDPIKLEQYNNGDEKIRQDIVNRAISMVMADKTKPIVKDNDEYKRALKAHGKGVIGQTLSGAIPEIEKMESANGAKPVQSEALKKYLDLIAQEQQKDTKEFNEEEQVELTQEKPKPKIYQYKDKSKASTDPGLLKKAMKGLSMEECVKKFLKPLLKDLQDIFIIEQPKDPNVVEGAADAKAREEEARKNAEELKRQQEEERDQQKAEQNAQAVNGNNMQPQAEGDIAQPQNGEQVQPGENADNTQIQPGMQTQIVQGTPVQVVQGASAQPHPHVQISGQVLEEQPKTQVDQAQAQVEQPTDNIEQQKDVKTQPIQVTNREHEASIFLPAWAIINDAFQQKRKEAVEKNLANGIKSIRDRMEDLTKVFEVLSSVDDNPNYTKDESGRDFSDKCRKIAIGICTGRIKDRASVQQELEDAMQGCTISDERKSALRRGFNLIEPELMLYLLDFSSDIGLPPRKQDGTLGDYPISLGSKLQHPVFSEMNSAKDDKSRRIKAGNVVRLHLVEHGKAVALTDEIIQEYIQKVNQNANAEYKSDAIVSLDDEGMDM